MIYHIFAGVSNYLLRRMLAILSNNFDKPDENKETKSKICIKAFDSSLRGSQLIFFYYPVISTITLWYITKKL